MNLCWCGCGELADLRFKRFAYGHNTQDGRGVHPDYWQYGVEKDEHGCWLWTGSLSHNGYARMYVKGKEQNVHRHVYETMIGDVPAGHQIDHRCRVRRCINPEHLEAVTPTENIRRASGTKLTVEQVKEIRESSEDYRAVANKLGISPEYVHSIRRGLNWEEAGLAPRQLGNGNRGESNAKATLTEDNVREIRKLGRTTDLTQREIAELFGVTQSAVWGVLSGRYWKHVI